MSISVKQRKICRPKLKSAAFIRAIPLAWVQQAARLPGKALHVALVIWYQVGVEKSGTIRFSMKLSRQFGVLRHAVSRNLALLEEARLIKVERHRGRLPDVIMLDGFAEPSIVETMYEDLRRDSVRVEALLQAIS